MKKLILGLAAVGAVAALRPVLKRRMAQEMREHCEQMAAHCKEMMGGGATGGGAMPQTMRDHCAPATEPDERTEPVVAA